MEKQLPQPGWRYRHFKGGLYQIVTLALNTETGEDMVVYQALYDDFKTTFDVSERDRFCKISGQYTADAF